MRGSAYHHAFHLLPVLIALVAVTGAVWQGVRASARGRTAQLVASAAVLAAAAAHVAAAQQHAGGQRVFFLVVAVLQVGLSVEVLRRPAAMSSPVVLSSAGLVLLWWESRTVGLVLGVEPVGSTDLLTVCLELTALVAARWLSAVGSRPIRLDREVAAWALIVVASALALTT